MKNPLKFVRVFAGISAATIIVAGCTSWQPVAGVPVNVDLKNGSQYVVSESHASYSDGTLLVSGQLRFSPGTTVSRTAHFDIQVFNAEGKLVAAFPAKLERDDFKHGPGDQRLRASFYAKTKISLGEVAKIKADYDTNDHSG